ncbi:MAG: hypothetical protein OSA43_12160 [Pirellulales bacterium]|jgi:hypothetical protein|nr:hypothetical protein [Pirellulales bacterium]
MSRRSKAMLGIARIFFVLILLCGCHGPPTPGYYGDDGPIEGDFLVVPEEELVEFPNPSAFAPMNGEAFWTELIDITSDYFRIAREQRVQNVGGQWLEGEILTYPQTGATFLEPWRWDSVTQYERTLATLQSIRRTARIRIIPQGNGYLVDVQVLKDLEDVARPERDITGVASFRFGETVSQSSERIAQPGEPACWIPIGRDTALEQEILGRLYERMNPTPF